MSYLCRKGLNISGTAYKPGDVIPDGAILPNRVRTLKAVGMISEVAENDGTPVVNSQPVVSGSELSTISIPVKGENGDINTGGSSDGILTAPDDSQRGYHSNRKSRERQCSYSGSCGRYQKNYPKCG